jgi:hypothetical protein
VVPFSEEEQAYIRQENGISEIKSMKGEKPGKDGL